MFEMFKIMLRIVETLFEMFKMLEIMFEMFKVSEMFKLCLKCMT